MSPIFVKKVMNFSILGEGEVVSLELALKEGGQNIEMDFDLEALADAIRMLSLGYSKSLAIRAKSSADEELPVSATIANGLSAHQSLGDPDHLILTIQSPTGPDSHFAVRPLTLSGFCESILKSPDGIGKPRSVVLH